MSIFVSKKVEKAGYIVRERSKDDDRVVVITLTKDGRAFQKKAKDVPLIDRQFDPGLRQPLIRTGGSDFQRDIQYTDETDYGFQPKPSGTGQSLCRSSAGNRISGGAHGGKYYAGSAF